MAVWDWSATAANNATADGAINWQEGQSAPSVNNSARGMMQRLRQFADDTGGAILTGSTATNAYTVTTSGTLAALRAGITLRIRANHTNTGAVTLNVDGLGVKGWKDRNGANFSANHIISESFYDVAYHPVSDEWRSPHLASQVLFTTNNGSVSAAPSTSGRAPLEIVAITAADAAYLTLHRLGTFAVHLGLDTDNELKVGGWSLGANAYKIWSDRSATFNASANGYCKLPNGFIVQWGNGAGGGADFTVTLPIAFPTACLAAFATVVSGTAAGTLEAAGVNIVSASQITVRPRAVAGSTVVISGSATYWMAVGN